jgi:hypothetical protein
MQYKTKTQQLNVQLYNDQIFVLQTCFADNEQRPGLQVPTRSRAEDDG